MYLYEIFLIVVGMYSPPKLLNASIPTVLDNYGESPLYSASRHDCLEIAELLLEANASVHLAGIEIFS